MCYKTISEVGTMSVRTQATIEDLYHVDGKAELVNGEIVHMPPTGAWPGRAGGAIYASLREHERETKSYHADETQNPHIFRGGDMATADDAVPGWSMPVDDLFQDKE